MRTLTDAMETMGQPKRAQRKEETRRRVLDVAARAVRRHGPAGVSVAAIMREAGLTHGTFYAHFASKDDLVAAAIEHAAVTFRAKLWAEAKALARTEPIARHLGAAYLSPRHATDRAGGCFIAALGPEMTRASAPVAGAFARGVEGSIAMIQAALDEAEGPDPGHRARAAASLATAVGGLIIARAAPDEASRDAILQACRDRLAERGSAARRPAPDPR
jgi:TetR/AcrR family transcriptional repressor of nem operon